jgi:creatinine amidohydrolase
MKYRFWDMSWMEAQEAFRKSDTVIIPVGTLHGHGPTPLSIDSSSVEKLADEVGRRTGLPILPLMPYGEDNKMLRYPGSIAISPDVLEGVYTDICKSLHRNGVRKIIFLNGHGGNRDSLVRTARKIRELGMVVAILEWWSIGKKLMPELWPEPKGSYMSELAVAIAIGGKDIIDLRKGGYRGEWGSTPILREIFGEKIKPLGFDDFEYKGAQIFIPVDAWDIDVDSPPELSRSSLDQLRQRGEEILSRLADYVAEFAKDFARVDPKVLKL